MMIAVQGLSIQGVNLLPLDGDRQRPSVCGGVPQISRRRTEFLGSSKRGN